ncbi:MAG: deoxyribodipyrimidine photo-lyase, partial [Pseudomonadota bacterium]
TSPIIVWFRRDLRLGDHPVVAAAVRSGRPLIPVFLLDEVVETHGAAPKWRLGLGVRHLARRLERMGSRLVLRRGRAADVLESLVKETSATAVWWSRLYDPDSIARDTAVKTRLTGIGVDAKSHPGHVLFEPWEVRTRAGGMYKVYTPYWKAVRGFEAAEPLPLPSRLPVPGAWPPSENFENWRMGAAMRRGAGIVGRYATVGEEAAHRRLNGFMACRIDAYDTARNFVAREGTSGLSENLTYGEIGPQACWRAGKRALAAGRKGAETFLKELVWREFAYHLVYHTPQITCRNWKRDWDAFPWSEDENAPAVIAWKRGRTGIPFVDAGMRQMYVTGIMHNRARMIAASYLTKHLLSHWRIGLKWFADCLIDWDAASNALGWQWSAGSGPDAAPYFRIFNPITQLDKFDADRDYTTRWIAEGHSRPAPEALQYFDAIPESWPISPRDPYPDPIVTVGDGRERALAAYENRGF